MSYINITKENIHSEHICCAFSDKKCAESYALKKDWLKNEFDSGYVFFRLNERAKVFIEYVSAEKSWIPVDAENYMMINCFWVSGKYKGHGHGKALLQRAIDDAKEQNMNGMVSVVGNKKFHFMSDGKWFQKQGFEVCDCTEVGFILLVKKFDESTANPKFKDIARAGECKEKKGLVAYYSNRCPFTEYHMENSLKETAEKRNIPLKIIKLKTMKEAQKAPTPATIFSLFYNGKFITTDLSVCMDSKFDKFMEKNGLG